VPIKRRRDHRLGLTVAAELSERLRQLSLHLRHLEPFFVEVMPA